MCKYGVFSGPYFSVLGVNTRKYGSKKTPYLDTFEAVSLVLISDVLNSLENFLFYPLTVGIKDSAVLFQETFSSIRSSRLQMFFEIGALKNFAILIGKRLCRSPFLIKLQP